MDGKWQKQQDQRAIQSREINNGSYLVTWVTSCSSRQPLPNLWASLVNTEPQRHLVHLLRVQTTIFAPFLLTQGARPLALPAAGRRCRQAASQSPPQVAIRVSINLKCAI